MNNYFLTQFILGAIIFLCLIGCRIPTPIMRGDEGNSTKTNYIYSPELIDDSNPGVEGDFFKIAVDPKINANQKILIEAILHYFSIDGFRDYSMPSSSKEFYSAYYVQIEGVGITDLSALKGLENASLDFFFSFTSTRLKDISALYGFNNVSGLTFRGSDIEDFTPISSMTHLRWLDIAYSKNQDLSALVNLINLEELTIDKESNLSLEPIKHLFEKHKNTFGKDISLKINYVSNLYKTKSEIIENGLNGSYSYVINGKYELKEVFYASIEDDEFVRNTNVSGHLLLNSDNTFEMNLSTNSELDTFFNNTGTYRFVGNLIYFKPKNKDEYVTSCSNLFKSYGIGDSLEIYDRVSYPKASFVGLGFFKNTD